MQPAIRKLDAQLNPEGAEQDAQEARPVTPPAEPVDAKKGFLRMPNPRSPLHCDRMEGRGTNVTLCLT